MKRRHIVMINLVFLCLVFVSATTVYEFMTGSKPLDFLRYIKSSKPVTVSTNTCAPQKPLNLTGAKSGQLKTLATYQQACHSYATGTMMTFVGMPMSTESATAEGMQTAATLKDFAKYKVTPLVIAEQTDYTTNANLDMGKFASSSYTSYLDTMFQTMQQQGVTPSIMGIWNPFPEANLPYWNNNQPQYFAPDVNIYVSELHKYFAGTKTSIMLNTATYSPDDFNWQNANYESLLPFVKGITPKTIDYAGLEGFPWVPPHGGSGPILNAAEFLNPTIISEAADYLGTKNIWLNTGTFLTKYALDPSQIAYVTPEQRQAILTTIDQQALTLQGQGYKVSVNLFAQDKSHSSEETNWSYWSNNAPFNSPSAPVFTGFVQKLNQQKINFWLFDK